MQIFKTDLRMKYVIAEIDGRMITVSFYDTFWKGVHNVSVRAIEAEKIKIESTYPGFVQRFREVVLLIKVELENAVNRISKCRR